jgi:hypothetical protein
MRETAALLGASFGRLLVLFLLFYLLVLFLQELPYVALPLTATLSAIGNAGFICALETTRQGRAPSILDMLYPWKLPTEKLVLLVLGGMLPILVGMLVWWLDLGADRFVTLLQTTDPAQIPSVGERIEFDLVIEVAATPLFFLAPFCVLYTWSASRTVSATVLAGLANWPWLVGYCAVSVGIDLGFIALDATRDLALVPVGLAANIAVTMFSDAFTLVLMLRCLHD